MKRELGLLISALTFGAGAFAGTEVKRACVAARHDGASEPVEIRYTWPGGGKESHQDILFGVARTPFRVIYTGPSTTVAERRRAPAPGGHWGNLIVIDWRTANEGELRLGQRLQPGAGLGKYVSYLLRCQSES